MLNNKLAMELQSFQSDFLFFQSEKDNLRKKYLNKFVAISGAQVIAFGSSIDEVKSELDRQGIDPEKTVVEFVPEEETVMIL